MAIDQFFFELIRVANGTQETLSRPPSGEEWKALYETSKKQSLVGICFAGIQRLKETGDSSFFTLNSSLYLTWMGMAAKIQQRNEVVNKQCHELKKRLSDEGFCSCILKGQGVAKLYKVGLNGSKCSNGSEGNLTNSSNTSNTFSLSLLRQSGDIDVWVWPKGDWKLNHEERVKKIRILLKKVGYEHTTYHNSSARFFIDTEVEVHYTPSWMYSPLNNRRLQRWFGERAQKEMELEFSSVEFNMVYVLLHIYRHMFGEGIGLRQVLDYYFVLMQGQESKDESLKVLEVLGVRKFAGALMYIMESHLGMDENFLLCPADPEEGAFLLSEIMQAGNFGHYDERISRERKGLLGGFWLHVKRNMHFVTHYPSEVLWCPLWKVWHQLWLRKVNK